MKTKRLAESAREWEGWAAAGVPAWQIVDAMAQEGIGAKRGPGGLRAGDSAWMGGVGATGIHPWRLVESDGNGIARLCRVIHDFGEGKMRICRRVLENPGRFGKGVRVAAWRALTGMRVAGGTTLFRDGFRRGRIQVGSAVVWEWARLRAGLRIEGEGWVRCLVPDGGDCKPRK